MVTKAKKKKTKKKATKKKVAKKKITSKELTVIKDSEVIIKTTDDEYPQIKYKFGRPTKYQPIFCEYAIHYLSKGLSKEAVAGVLCIAKQTLYDWIKKYPDFADAITIGVEFSRLHWENLTVNHVVHTKNGKQINGQVYALNMKNRFNWKDKQEIDLGEETKKTFGFSLDKKPEEIS